NCSSVLTTGYVWDFETIDTADIVDDTGLMEMEQMNELLVGKNVSLSCMVKIHERGEPYWRVPKAFKNSFIHGPLKSFVSLCVSPVTYLMATTALDRTVRVYDFIGNVQLAEMKLKQGGTALTWAPKVVNPKGGVIAAGFQDGVVRIIELYNPKGLPVVAGRETVADAALRLKQAFKPHTNVVTALAYERDGEMLATGSRDKTVFFFTIDDKYEPVGFISVPGPVQALQWSPPSHPQSTLLIFCENGIVVQVPAPNPGDYEATSTYKIKDLPAEYFRFWSIKSHILVKEEVKIEKEKAKQKFIKEQMDQGKELEEIEFPEEQLQEEEPLPDIYIPQTPSPILCGFYSAPGKFWLSLGGLDKERAAKDIEDPNAYSIENAKQKKEYDEIMRAAELKKYMKRQELITLQQEFQNLLQMNSDLPKHMQLNRAVCMR
uniref:Cilia and flagella associated protein 44 n=1 Tax=Varanus komodoensis TaxID=61221 RepID=A0A8D2LUA1_VARKO